MGRYLVLFEVHLPFAQDLPNPGDTLGGSLRGQGEHLAAVKCVVEGCDPSLRPDAQVQAPLRRQTRSRHDIVQRTQPPSEKARVPNKAVVAEMIIVVIDEDVEDEALKQLAIVLAYHVRVAVSSNRLCQISIGLIRRFHLIARQKRKTADKPQTLLCQSVRWNRAEKIFRQRGILTCLGPISVEAADEHYAPGTKMNQPDRRNGETRGGRQSQRRRLKNGNQQRILPARKFSEPQHPFLITNRRFRPCTAERAALREDFLELGRNRQALVDALGSVHQVFNVVPRPKARRGSRTSGRPDIDRSHTLTARMEQIT